MDINRREYIILLPLLILSVILGVYPNVVLNDIHNKDRDHTDSRRIEPNSRTSLISEQLNPSELLHPEDEMSRHRGVKPFGQCELSQTINLFFDFKVKVYYFRPDKLSTLFSINNMSYKNVSKKEDIVNVCNAITSLKR
ncbi:hypothetical protein IEQ34_024616 [Dendrobium chrysotoxum]|uniref:Uncharacterized protein n=1 Tax=Dendrobium chrysotoxum TaxID=161865 RepID=A0AAV7FT80_DENCH|nr:hypothetical protein IEQ34_024616 [Dendrobium chrysotoxum]